MRNLQLIIFAFLISSHLSAQNVTGDWYGEVGGGKNKIQFIFHVTQGSEGLETTMDIPGRNLKGIKTQKTTFENNQFHIDGRNFGFEYFAEYLADSALLKGKFKEGANEVPLILVKEKPELIEAKKRSQEPIKPYPYREEEVSFRNEIDDIELAGTLTSPLGTGKFPVVILITGSGPQNRDEEIFGHKPFLVIADHLTRLGIGVLRFDDRGVNKSTGNFTDATTTDFATDVESAMAYLKTRDDIDRDQIGLIGHSEGGIIAPIVAVNTRDIAFMVLLAGTGVSGYETSQIQATTLRAFPVPDEEAYNQFITNALDIASADKDVALVREELTAFYDKSPFFNAMAGTGEQRDQVLKGLVETRTTKWIRYFYNYNPAEILEQVKCPVLSLNGTKDLQVVADRNQAGIKAALVKGKNKDYEVITMEGFNHFFQEAETGAMSEYAEIEETFSPKALKIMSDWILERIKLD